MRDPARIDPFLNELAALWKEHPDWRFGQLVLNLSRDSEGRILDPWSFEEPEMIRRIRALNGSPDR